MTDAERAAMIEGAAWAKHEAARENGELTNMAPWERCTASWKEQGRGFAARELPAYLPVGEKSGV